MLCVCSICFPKVSWGGGKAVRYLDWECPLTCWENLLVFDWEDGGVEVLLVDLLVDNSGLLDLTSWIDLLVDYRWLVVLRDLSGVVTMLGGKLIDSLFSGVHC